MKKSTKGAAAAATAGVLLLGGAGSLAYWNASQTVGGGTINSGKLTLTDTTTNGCAAASWTFDSAESPAGKTYVAGTDTIVPGDTLTKTCTYTIGAQGTHLRANLAATGAGATGDLASAVTASGTFTVGGSTVSSITSADDTKVLTAKITLTFNSASDNTTQQKAVTLADYVVTATQVHG